jgi:hypothetical protein
MMRSQAAGDVKSPILAADLKIGQRKNGQRQRESQPHQIRD